MSEHDDVRLLLPWYANGTLGASEHGRVEGHVESCAACGDVLRQARLQLAAPPSAELLAHVHPALLTTYEEEPDRLEPETRAWIEDRLADCVACRESFLGLREVSRKLASSPAAPRRSWSDSLRWAWFGTLLRPAFALAYLLILVVLVPLLFRGPAVPRATSPRLMAIQGDRLTRAPGDLVAVPLPIDAGPGPVLLQLQTDLTADDLRDAGLSFSVEILRDGDARWTAPASALEVRDGRVVASMLLDPDRWPPGEIHEVALRAHKPGDPLDGQILFRKSFQVVE